MTWQEACIFLESYKNMYNGVMSASPYGCHVRFFLSLRRENEEIEGCLPLAKRYSIIK
jgi:hypothetical protein